MHRGRVLFAAGMALAASWFVAQAAAPASTQAAEAVTTGPVDGVSIGEWTARWWRWALTQPVQPFLDPDGRFCAMGQDGPVWFLAGTDGSFRPRRECAIPAGKHVLVPVINMIYWQRSAAGARSPCRELQASAAVNNDHLRSAEVLLDGKPLGDVRLFRIRSEACFAMDPADPQSRLAAADGYWLMIKPLPSGRHSLVVGANYNASDQPYGGMDQNFEYVLHVGGMTTLSDAGRQGMPRREDLPELPASLSHAALAGMTPALPLSANRPAN